jgi:hypothetical protein
MTVPKIDVRRDSRRYALRVLPPLEEWLRLSMGQFGE